MNAALVRLEALISETTDYLRDTDPETMEYVISRAYLEGLHAALGILEESV